MVDKLYERVNTKKCYKCGILKPILEFTKNRCTRDGYAHICRECKNIKVEVDLNIKDKVCKKCGLRKPLDEFHKNRGYWQGDIQTAINYVKKVQGVQNGG
jgi:hypothetical protein